MLDLSNRHEIEYRRVLAHGKRVHEYTEHVDDDGFVTSRRGMSRQEYLVYYTRACAEDFLDRKRAEPGEWLVAVYRTRPERELLCSIRMRYGGARTGQAESRDGPSQRGTRAR